MDRENIKRANEINDKLNKVENRMSIWKESTGWYDGSVRTIDINGNSPWVYISKNLFSMIRILSLEELTKEKQQLELELKQLS